MDSLFPAGPANVPEQLTAPGPAYRRHAWLAMTGLLVFVVAYFALLGWFALLAWRIFSLIANGSGNWTLPQLIGGFFALFLTVFMAKALVFIKRASSSEDVELKPADEPALFAFLHKLADAAGAPRPHRVYLSARVNAAVFYDLSIANLILPSRKNLEIGLGLATVLSLGEFKAVLAHEFGHFAQRSMAVGRWVYIAQQIAAHIIAKRDALDAMLRVISSIDLRVAWIGWLLQLIVWSIRSLVELFFRVVVLAQRALSREMEYQADLVAASLTGSDALVHALHRLGPADDAWSRAIAFAGHEHAQGRPVRDLFAVQARILERMRGLLGDPGHGASPPLSPDGAGHRLFRNELAQPPKMWSTHPANSDREENLKRRYVPAAIDERSAMLLFADPATLCARVTAVVFQPGDAEPVPLEDTLARVDADFQQPALDSRYRGAYLGRCAFVAWKEVGDLYTDAGPEDGWRAGLEALYPDDLSGRIDRLRELEEELATLEAIKAGFLEAPGGIVRWRGGEIRKRQLPRAIADVSAELELTRESVLDHDRRCRSLHLAVARRLGAGWEDYMRSLAAVAHYASHCEADLHDANKLLNNTLGIVLADRKVSAEELRKLLIVARQLHESMAEVYAKANLVVVDAAVAARLGAADWPTALGALEFPPPVDANIQPWLNHVDSWVDATTGALSTLRRRCLEALLAAEQRMADSLDAAPGTLEPAPAPLGAPTHYPRLIRGAERKLQTKLDWWGRFQAADGVGASIARLLVAGAIVAAVVYAGASISGSAVHVFNGLAVPVRVAIDGSEFELGAGQSTEVTVAASDRHHVRTVDAGGALVEEFDAENEVGATAVYNVARAATMVGWDATYGTETGTNERQLGSPRWSTTGADYVFSDPPEEVKTKQGGARREVLSAFADGSPSHMVEVAATYDRPALIASHARWDGADSPNVLDWMQLAASQPGFPQLLEARLAANPKDVIALRLQQDAAVDESARLAACKRHQAAAAAAPGDGDWQYVALRCLPDGRPQDDAFIAARTRWPENGWLSFASGYSLARRGEYEAGRVQIEDSARRLPALREMLLTDAARIRRLLAGAAAADLGELPKQSTMLGGMVAVETGEGVAGTPLEPYALLARGELDAGLAKAEPGESAARLLWLAAASDGASKELVQRALAQTAGEGIDEATLWTSLALVAREGGDTAALLERARAGEDQDSKALLRFFDALRAGADASAAEVAMGDVSPRGRGQAYAMALVLRGRQCPAAWRENAKRLLFGPERPYFG